MFKFANAERAASVLSDFGYSRQRIQSVAKWLAQQSHGSIYEVPSAFQRGRYGHGFITHEQREDLIKHVKFCEQSNRCLSIDEIVSCVVRFKLRNEGVQLSALPFDFADVDAVREHVNRRWAWRSFTAWAVENVSKAWRPKSTSRVKGVSATEAASCTPGKVSNAIKDLAALFQELGIADTSGAIIPSEAWRILSTDEKGFQRPRRERDTVSDVWRRALHDRCR